PLSDDVMPPGSLQRTQVLFRDEAPVHDGDDPAELPRDQVALDLLHPAYVGGLARPNPAPYGQARARHRQADHDLGPMRTLIGRALAVVAQALLVDRFVHL